LKGFAEILGEILGEKRNATYHGVSILLFSRTSSAPFIWLKCLEVNDKEKGS
jgi:hypothetical protein